MNNIAQSLNTDWEQQILSTSLNNNFKEILFLLSKKKIVFQKNYICIACSSSGTKLQMLIELEPLQFVVLL